MPSQQCPFGHVAPRPLISIRKMIRLLPQSNISGPCTRSGHDEAGGQGASKIGVRGLAERLQYVLLLNRPVEG